MSEAQIKKVPLEPADLPQIHLPLRDIADTEDREAAEKNAAQQAVKQEDIDKLTKVVEGSFEAIAMATGLSETDVLRLMESINVEMQADVLKDPSAVDGLKDGVNVDLLKEGIQEAIKNISLATSLNTDQITDVLSANKHADLNDLVERLYKSAQSNREKFRN